MEWRLDCIWKEKGGSGTAGERAKSERNEGPGTAVPERKVRVKSEGDEGTEVTVKARERGREGRRRKEKRRGGKTGEEWEGNKEQIYEET